MDQAVLSFNAEPFPVPRPFKEYRIAVGDKVTFRTRMGKLNNDLIEEIVSKIGRGPHEVIQLGTRKHRLRNDDGIEAWVPRLFLAPPDVPSDE